MFYGKIGFQLLLLAFSFQWATQSDKQVQQQDSVTVSGGLSKEQLALEDQLKAIITQGDSAFRSGNMPNAIAQYESARDLVNKEPLLAEQRNHALEKLAQGYTQGGRAKDAIPIYLKLLEAKKKDCDSATFALSSCASSQHSLGIAQIYAGDFQGALGSLRNAEMNYSKAEKLTEFHELSVVEVKDGAQVEVLIAVALSRLGKNAEAVTTCEAAISQLARVESDQSVEAGIRGDAARSLRDAQDVLARLKSAL